MGAVLLGLVAGAIARLLVPGDAFKGMKGPKSWLLTFLLGIAGAFVGWVIFSRGLGIGDSNIFDLCGIVGAVVGAFVLLVDSTIVMRRTGRA